MSSWINRNIAWIISPVGLLIISTTRLLIISDYNTTTATTIASSGGYINTLLGTVIPLIPILLPYAALLLLAFRHPILSGLCFLASAVISPSPIRAVNGLRRSEAEWHLILNWIDSHLWIWFAVAGVLILVLTLMIAGEPFNQIALKTVNVIWVLAVLAAAIPLLLYIYPVPGQGSYWATLLRQPWLPAQAITLKSGQIYYGYTVSDDNDWFVILLVSSRTIVYVPAGDVTGRLVCQVEQGNLPPQFPPLVTILNVTPSRVPKCPDRDSSGAATSPLIIPRSKPLTYLSHGESLNVISSAVHVSPQEIISETNAYQQQRLSKELRTYENTGNWNAPTPIGQHFWYYPPLESQSLSSS